MSPWFRSRLHSLLPVDPSWISVVAFSRPRRFCPSLSALDPCRIPIQDLGSRTFLIPTTAEQTDKADHLASADDRIFRPHSFTIHHYYLSSTRGIGRCFSR